MKTFAIATMTACLIALVATGAAEAQRGGRGGGGGGGSKSAPSKPLPPSPEYTTGVVGTYVPETRTLKFNTGGSYKLSPAAGDVAIHAGDKVQLRWLMKGDTRVADEATVTMKAPPPEPAPDKASADAPASAPAATDAPASSS
ncbi:MAG: hypothetical protein GC155_08210 [Alphaproteobacteria bacterium]|nr:hypothetical protein [Alphaproteobacteria bacterium]